MSAGFGKLLGPAAALVLLLLVCGVASASGAGEPNLTLAEEKALLENVFASQLETIDADPARVLGDVAIDRIDSPTEALVTVEGDKVLLESEIPLRAPEDDGDLGKVDLALEEDAAGGFSPANPLVDLSLPESADEPIAIGDSGLTLSLEGGEETTASPLGDENLFLPEAREDTSLLLSPISGGLELSAMLLSPSSPERLSFAVDLPEGESLRSSEEGGAEVLDAADEVVARVSAPRAVDADGEVLPVELSVEGDSLVLSVPHREADVAYPLFVDPQIIEENWSGFSDTSKLNYWFWQYSGVGAEDYVGWRSCISTCWGKGLYVRARNNFTYPAGSYGRWGFVPQGNTTYMRRVIFGPMHFDPHGCTGNEPHGYVGVWNSGGFWSVLAPAYPSGLATWVDTGEQNLGTGARTAFVAVHSGATTKTTCGRDYQLGGATLFLEDPENATVGTPSGYPSGWIKDNSPFTVNVPVSDPGLGVKSATVNPAGAAPLSTKSLTCTAHYNDQCPASHTFQLTVSADSFDQGEKAVRASAEDAIGHGSNTAEWMMKVDRTPPEIELDGQLAEATDETGTDEQDPEKWDALTLPVYNLQIAATDGSTASAASKRSGVKTISVYLDDKTVPEKSWTESSCPASSCPMSRTFTLKLNELSADTHHTLRVFAQDFAGNTPRERRIEFEYIPATGIKEGDVMQYFPLPDGQGNEDEEEHPSRPELAVNVLNGNLVYRQQDAEVQGVGADLGLDLYYNSLLPESQNSEWGDGWTLAQAPDLELEEPEGAGPATEATIVEESGGVESKVDLPSSVGEGEFDKRLQATVTKEAGGDYGLTDESGESDQTLVFDESGKVEEARTGSSAIVNYDYEGGDLAGLSIEDPGTAMVAPESLEEDEAPAPPEIEHSADLGSSGTADGQLEEPADVAVDPQSGDLWVVDRGNDRLQRFGPDGQFLSKFGTPGGAQGQISDPNAIAIDAAGNLLVAESSRVQKFSPGGQFISSFGSYGIGNGKLFEANGIVVGADGSIWVSDSLKVQRFSAAGQFIERVSGSGPGELTAPRGLGVDGEGNVFAVDPNLDLVKVYDEEGDFLRQFGSSGSGPGQFSDPTAIEADADGYVWVTDDQLGSVQLFDSAGDYIAQFGSPGGSEPGFRPLTAISSDGKGRVWVSDREGDRVATELGGHYEPSNEPALTEDDPQLEVDVSEGLVESVEGEEVGALAYEHSGDLLTAVSKPEGEVQFAYDEAGRMTKVTLPNGTYGEVAYADTYGRVKSVTVSVEGAAPKTTYFEYSDEPRRTTVTPPDAPATTYDISANGSVFKWSNAKQPPIFDDIAGSLYDANNRETSEPINTGAYNLVVQAHSAEGIASIQVIANSNQLVDEKTCEQDPEKPGIECVTQEDEWVTETGSWAPGILYLEVIATDRLGQTVSERFWVNIPYTPPPAPEAEEPPRFNDILKFRQEFGLDLDLKGDEIAINDRIFELMGDWNNPNTPAGEVARITAARWGVPLRQVDAAELEYRQRYVEQAASVIPAWAEANAPTQYAGYYVDHRAGGIVRVGFTQDQAGRVASLAGAGTFMAPGRLAGFPAAPQHSYSELVNTQGEIAANASSLPSFTRLSIDIEHNIVKVGTTSSISAMAAALVELLGQYAPAEAFLDSAPPVANVARAPGRERVTGRIKAGDRIISEYGGCTANFGSWLRSTGAGGTSLYKHFLLTAAHCAPAEPPTLFERERHPAPYVWENKNIGRIKRTGLVAPGVVDGAAILLQGDASSWAPRYIYLTPNIGQPVTGVAFPTPGMLVCTSGASTNLVKSGEVEGSIQELSYQAPEVEGAPWVRNTWEVPVAIPQEKGDSGAPAWQCGTGNAVGLWNAGGETSWVTPLLPTDTGSTYEAVAPLAAGAFAKLGLNPGNLSLAP